MTAKKTDANRYLFLDVEAERRGILDGHGIHCATALERLTRHSFKLKQTQSIQVGETASSPASGGGGSNSTATGESESGKGEKKPKMCKRFNCKWRKQDGSRWE